MERGMHCCVRVDFFMIAKVNYTLAGAFSSHLRLDASTPLVQFSSPSSSGYTIQNLPYEGQYYTRRRRRSSYR